MVRCYGWGLIWKVMYKKCWKDSEEGEGGLKEGKDNRI